MRHIVTLCHLILLIGCMNPMAYAEGTEHTKSWSTAYITGSMPNSSRYRYYVQPTLIFIDNRYRFERASLLLGIGYRYSPDLSAWFMNGWRTSKSRTNGTIHQRYTIREQLDWRIYHHDDVSLLASTRFMQENERDERRWAIRAREKISLRIPLRNWPKHSLSMFEELLFNINHPAWINSSSLLDQNRFFIGIGTQFTRDYRLDIGYMNQYQIKHPDELSHILYVAFYATYA